MYWPHSSTAAVLTVTPAAKTSSCATVRILLATCESLCVGACKLEHHRSEPPQQPARDPDAAQGVPRSLSGRTVVASEPPAPRPPHHLPPLLLLLAVNAYLARVTAA